jgi:hypothetical protein
MESVKTKLKSGRFQSTFMLVSLAVLLAAAMSFIIWQNFIYQSPTPDTTVVVSTNQTQIPKTSSNVDTTPEMLEYGNGVAISMQSDLVKLTDSPASFKSYLSGLLEPATISSTDDGCTFEITVKKIYKQQYALGSTQSTGPGCGSGYATLWGDAEGSWKKIAGSQEKSFGCSNLEKYKVPSKIAGTMCIDDGAPEGKTYSQE